MTALDANRELIDAGDLDELIRHADRLADAGDWESLDDLRRRSRRAFEERGRQLWPVATRAEYRMALDAPGRWAASVVVDGAGHLGPGPLPEVAASTHAWADLVDHLAPGPAAGWCAHECIARGQDLSGDDRVDPAAPDLPLCLQPWEPAYPAAVYEVDGVQDVPPATPPLERVRAPAAPAEVDDPATAALLALVERWVVSSNGRARAVAVEGGPDHAVASLGVEAFRAVEVPASVALAHMAWAAASGGAHGRRSGLARGRFDAWWALASLCGLDDSWPPDPDELGRAAAELTWWLWAPADRAAGGWVLDLAVSDPADGLAWALRAEDHA